MLGVLLLGSLSLCLKKLHSTSPFPCNHTPNLPFQNNVQLEEVGSHIALFFGKEKTGSFYLHRRDFAELPSEEKKNRKRFRNTKDLRALEAASLQEPILFSAVSRARDAAAPRPQELCSPCRAGARLCQASQGKKPKECRAQSTSSSARTQLALRQL